MVINKSHDVIEGLADWFALAYLLHRTSWDLITSLVQVKNFFKKREKKRRIELQSSPRPLVAAQISRLFRCINLQKKTE